MKKYFSYSELRCYEQSPEEYYARYVLGEELPPTPEMELGTLIHAAIEDTEYGWEAEAKKLGHDEGYIAQLGSLIEKARQERLPQAEATITAITPQGTELLSILDGFDPEQHRMQDFKTTRNRYRWNQRIVDENEQLSFYAYVYKLATKSFFREMSICCLDTSKVFVKPWYTVRGPRDIAHIADKIERTCDEIYRLGWWESRLSKEERLSK